MPSHIEDYGLIGDCETAALVSRGGSIDWLCWPNFSSAACFAALLGDDGNGHWRIQPKNPSRVSRCYRDHTLILETTFETDGGTVKLIDFMPNRGNEHSDIIRIVRGLRGEVEMSMELIVRFDYGRTIPWVTAVEGEQALRLIAGPDMIVLRTPIETHGENMKTEATFTVKKGQSVPFVLTYGRSFNPVPRSIDVERALSDTEAFWVEWTGRSPKRGQYSDAVERSLITLKALTYRHTGGIVAAPTTSLPEYPGGMRNWDYRYCWLRDATFTLLALMNAGYYEEAEAWRDWLLRSVAGSPDQVQIMYGVRGERMLTELEIPWLSGYQNSKPVRIGNAASDQLQLDVYGEVVDALYHAHLGGIKLREVDLALVEALMNHLVEIWDQPDEGIWEVRGAPQPFTYSKVMAWVALDRAIALADEFPSQGDVEKWRMTRAAICEQVCTRGYNEELGSFVQAYGSKELDASLLLIPLVGFLPPSDARVRGTIEAIEKHLMHNGFVLRYDTERSEDGLPAGEGSFLACSFWMASALKMIGREEDGKRLLERLLRLRNDLGLLAEEYDARAGNQLGNFPQALSHISLINAALDLDRENSPQQRGSKAIGESGSSRPPHEPAPAGTHAAD